MFLQLETTLLTIDSPIVVLREKVTIKRKLRVFLCKREVVSVVLLQRFMFIIARLFPSIVFTQTSSPLVVRQARLSRRP